MQTQSLPQPQRRKPYSPQHRVLPFDRKDYFNSREVGELFGVSYVTIHRAAHAGSSYNPLRFPKESIIGKNMMLLNGLLIIKILFYLEI